ncbi:antigen-presenting glycoprotein CD1d isoform X3 [Ailuropoda melanoleuca]|uniref:antigen-presenting glycoprotein CD1d isoform X3 n=1 Tax=Ailuropoda melanoleuca TaxID=9646 RepID=UPI001493E39C|nr:antigen-presenting glycoprotein CD1d isoform X3 [Ailuropoda melanoleuca]
MQRRGTHPRDVSKEHRCSHLRVTEWGAGGDGAGREAGAGRAPTAWRGSGTCRPTAGATTRTPSASSSPGRGARSASGSGTSCRTHSLCTATASPGTCRSWSRCCAWTVSRDPFEIQVSAGCELRAGNISESFFHAAFQGGEIMSFQGAYWAPAPDAPDWAGRAAQALNQDQGTRKTLQSLLNDTCPQFARGLLEAGKSELEKQVKPEVWLSTGPSPGPGRLLLVCHVSGFHPKPVWVMWMRGEQEQWATQQGDVLPHADETWYLRVTLDVEAREAAGLSCRVRHSSLGGQDIIIHWEGSHSSWLIPVALLGSLLMIGCVGCLALWYRKRRSYQDIL